MSIGTYPELQQAIARWAIRTGDVDFEAACPDFITLAESRLNSDLRVVDMEQTAIVEIKEGKVALPADFLSARLMVNTAYPYGEIPFATPQYQAHYLSTYGHNGLDPSSGTLTYYAKIPPLSVAAPTNWLLTKYPNLYLYACLLEASPFMEEDTRAPTWKAYYGAAITAANRDDTMARYPYGEARVMQDTP